MKAFRLLRADEIECRVQSVRESELVLLLYKDARCDQNILDETVGAWNWQRHHSRDNANCIVSIWDTEKQMWVEKEDTGTDSNTEAEKGRASDSFKRACFNWGIGRELYTAPLIWITDFERDNRGGCKERFSVSHIAYDENENISELVIVNRKGVVVFEMGKKAKEAEAPKEEPPKAEPQKKKQNFYAQTVAAKTDELSKVRCKLCGNFLTVAEVKWCESHADRYKGDYYCRGCQSIAEKGQVG